MVVNKKRGRRTAKPAPAKQLLGRKWTQGTTVLALAIALAFLIVFRAPISSPPLSRDLIGSEAASDFRATHAFTIAREDTTGLEEARSEAEAQVLPVWDFQLDNRTDVSGRITRTFTMMRGVLEAARALKQAQVFVHNGAQPLEGARVDVPGDPIDPTPSEGTGAEAPVAVEDPSVGVDLASRDPSQLPAVSLSAEEREQLSLAHRDKIVSELLIELRPETLRSLGLNGWSESTQATLQDLMYETLSHPLVYSISVVRAESRGIQLRTMQHNRVLSDVHRDDFSDFLDRPNAAQWTGRLLERLQPTALDPQLRNAIAQVAIELMLTNTNTSLNPRETEARQLHARQAIQPEIDPQHHSKGEILVHAGDEITEADFELVRVMEQTREVRPDVSSTLGIMGGVIFVLLILIGVMMYGVRYIRRFGPTLKDTACMTVVLLLMVILTKSIVTLGEVITEKNPDFELMAILVAIPFAAGAIMVRVVLNAESALIFSIIFSLLVALILPEHTVFSAYALVGSLAGTGAAERVTTRMSLFRTGAVVGLVNVLFGAGLGLYAALPFPATLTVLGFGLFGGLLVAILVTALLPLLESVFHYITDIKLLELSDNNHPAVRELFLRAPGSYHHSMMVGTLVEAACKSIGANALLGRVGAYYHDIGKAKSPQHFAENQSPGENPHDKLSPHLSALIIKAHVKDGVEMANEYGLPKEIICFIQEHHGTSLIAFFYHKAKEQEDKGIQEVEEKEFRYPGPKPQSTETAVCMLADGIEAASRAERQPTAARLQGLVQRMINKAFTDGQLDECDLTLRDLDAIARAFIRVLTSIYHHRPEYPNQKKEKKDAGLATSQLRQVSKRASSPGDEDGRGDSDSANGDTGAASDLVADEGPATLKRLGIAQSRAVDSSHRRQRD